MTTYVRHATGPLACPLPITPASVSPFPLLPYHPSSISLKHIAPQPPYRLTRRGPRTFAAGCPPPLFWRRSGRFREQEEETCKLVSRNSGLSFFVNTGCATLKDANNKIHLLPILYFQPQLPPSPTIFPLRPNACIHSHTISPPLPSTRIHHGRRS